MTDLSLFKTRVRIFFCACERKEEHSCDPEFTWYEPQDIQKGIRLAREKGYPEEFFYPYKKCYLCKYH